MGEERTGQWRAQRDHPSIPPMTGGYFAAELKKGRLEGIVLTVAYKPSYLLVETARVCDPRRRRALGRVARRCPLQRPYRATCWRSVAWRAMSPIATVIYEEEPRQRGAPRHRGAARNQEGDSDRSASISSQAAPSIGPRWSASGDESRPATRVPLLSFWDLHVALHGTAMAIESWAARGLTDDELPPFAHGRPGEHRGIRMSQTILRERLTCTGCPVRCRREVGSDGPRPYTTEGPDYSQLSSLGIQLSVRYFAALGYLN